METHVIPDTDFETNDPLDNRYFQILKDTVQADASTHGMGERSLAVNPCWVRDHIHEMKAYKWWKTDITSFIDCLIDYQTPRGFFYEISISKSNSHYTYVTPEFKTAAGNDSLIRLEIEADIEYLMVEGVYQIWQATGDNDAMAKRLPALERGLEYDFNDPTRWDQKHGLLKRPFSIDTWDFVWGSDLDIRYITPDMPMVILHGDNSGLYQACLQVAKMNEALGKEPEAKKWRERAEGIRVRANALLWNGSFYTHQYHLTPVNTDIDETIMLSLSNPYDINRGMPTHEMAVKIIDEYRLRRQRNSNDFAEWYTIDPGYPDFCSYKQGTYCNGAISGFVGGELAKAALRNGREDYGANILRRLREIALEKGTIPFFIQRSDGEDVDGGPRGWSAAAVMSALMEGLAGLTDRGLLFQDIEVAPRYPAAGITKARAALTYGVSKAYVVSTYLNDPKEQKIMMQLAGNPQKVHFHVLLPKATIPSVVRVDDKPVNFTVQKIEQSLYCDFDVKRKGGENETSIAVMYKAD